MTEIHTSRKYLWWSYTSSFMFNATTVFELCRKRTKQQYKNVLPMTWTESGIFMKYSMHSSVSHAMYPKIIEKLILLVYFLMTLYEENAKP